MATEFKFPDVGEGITEGELVEWLVKEGEEVKEHQAIARVETDKAVVEIPSPKSGTILKINFKAGDTVKVGEVLAVIGDKGESVSAKPAEEKPTEEKKPEKKIFEGVVGYIEEAPDEEEEEVKPQHHTMPESTEKEILATPAVRNLAKEMNVDLSQIHGTGKGGRIEETDVKRSSQKSDEKSAIKITRKYDMYGYVERVPLKGIRKATARHMRLAVDKAAHVSHMDEADVTTLWEIRQREKKIAEMKGVKLTFLPFVMKACIHALRDHPYFNSELDEESQQIILKKYFNIGIAVESEHGLVVPVVKVADQKSILDLAREISELSGKVRDRKIDLGDLKGGTFTITNIGSIGGMFATPIVNYPEVAILGLGRIFDKLKIIDNQVKVRKMLPMSLSFDHRIVDGANAARFMNLIIQHLEDPEQIMIDRD